MNFDAAIFDMDGVVTNTTPIHAAAWKSTFDEYLRRREARCGELFREFTGRDYAAFVDGRPRYGGVGAFLTSRGIDIPFGDPADNPQAETVCGLGNRKNEVFNKALEEQGAEVFSSTVQLIHRLLREGVKVGLATSSKNCAAVLRKAGIADLFETCVDGVVSAKLGLSGKPEPDIFLLACDNLGAHPRRAMVVEDAVSGVQAARRGEFGLVLGVARENDADELLRHGADIVVKDLCEISLEEIDGWFERGAKRKSEASELLAQESI